MSWCGRHQRQGAGDGVAQAVRVGIAGRSGKGATAAGRTTHTGDDALFLSYDNALFEHPAQEIFSFIYIFSSPSCSCT